MTVSFQRVKQLFLRVRELPQTEQVTRLAQECRGDAALYAEVLALLRTSSHDGPLDAPALGTNFSVATAFAQSQHPTRIGGYRVVAVIGAGSRGIVYRGSDERDGAVALKVLRPSTASPLAAQHLRREALVLARLRHPGIAALLDHGTAELYGVATPFVAMEFVDGQPITVHARAEGLDVAASVELLARVGDAVQHAHDCGVVHRDLKPANVLVSFAGEPKLVDFGLAGDPAARARGSLQGTPGYLAPEVLRGGPAGPQADVYALGLVAYEVLAGRPAWPSPGVDALAPHQNGREPLPLSSHRPELRGDLETIVHHAIEADPQRRYRSAHEFVADLRRYLAGVPVRAPRASAWRRCCRLARRHRALALGIGATFLALAAGVAGTATALVSARRARAAEAEQRLLAEQRLREATVAHSQASRQQTRVASMFAYLNSVLGAASPHRARGKADLVGVVEAAVAKLPDTLVDDVELRGVLAHNLGATLLALGRYAAAEQQLRVAIGAGQEGGARIDLAIALLHGGRPAEAASELQRAIASLDDSPADRDLRHSARVQLARARRDLGDLPGAQQLAEACLAECDVGTTTLGDLNRLLARSLLGSLAVARGDFARAAALEEVSLQESIELRGQHHPETLDIMNNLGLARANLGQKAEGDQMLGEVLRLRRHTLGDDHPDTWESMHNLAAVHASRGEYEPALTLAAQVVERRTKALGSDHPRTLVSRNNQAWYLFAAGRVDEAEQAYRALLTSAQRALPKDHWQLGSYARNLGVLLQQTGRPAQALPLLREAHERFSAALGTEDPTTRRVAARLARVLEQLGEPEEAARLRDPKVPADR